MQTASAVQSFFLAMTMYPEVQRKAQVELDAVIGSNRLPDYNDREALPYVGALVKETMRWQLVAPSGTLNYPLNNSLCDFSLNTNSYGSYVQ